MGLQTRMGCGYGSHQENVRVIFGIFISVNHIFRDYVFGKWGLSKPLSLSQKVDLSYFEVFGCNNQWEGMSWDIH